MDDNIETTPGLVEQLATDIRTNFARFDIDIDDDTAIGLAVTVCKEIGMAALIAGSSLGTPAARSIRARTPPATVRKIVAQLIETEGETMNGGPTNPEDRPARSRFTSELGVVARAGHNHYVSTACIHARHDDCRWTCKFCQDRCQCPCHDGCDAPGVDTHHYELEAVDDQGNFSDGQKDLNVDEAMAVIRYHLISGKTVTASAMGEEAPGEETPGS